MKTRRHQVASNRAGSGLAAALILLVIGLSLLAVRPDQHLAFHAWSEVHCATQADADADADADAGASEGHEHRGSGHHDAGCAIKLFAGGQVEFVDGVLGSVLPTRLTVVVRVGSQSNHSPHLGLAPPGRAPPSLS